MDRGLGRVDLEAGSPEPVRTTFAPILMKTINKAVRRNNTKRSIPALGPKRKRLKTPLEHSHGEADG